MIRIELCVREPGKKEIDFSLPFNVPELPKLGDYISVHRANQGTPHTEDVVVRHVWWMLETPETRTTAEAGTERVGQLNKIFVECEMALGPYANDRWHETMLRYRTSGQPIEEFDVARVSVREKDLRGG